MNAVNKEYDILASELDSVIIDIKKDILDLSKKLEDESIPPELHETLCVQIEDFYNMIADLEQSKDQFKDGMVEN